MNLQRRKQLVKEEICLLKKTPLQKKKKCLQNEKNLQKENLQNNPIKL